MEYEIADRPELDQDNTWSMLEELKTHRAAPGFAMSPHGAEPRDQAIRIPEQEAGS